MRFHLVEKILDIDCGYNDFSWSYPCRIFGTYQTRKRELHSSRFSRLNLLQAFTIADGTSPSLPKRANPCSPAKMRVEREHCPYGHPLRGQPSVGDAVVSGFRNCHVALKCETSINSALLSLPFRARLSELGLFSVSRCPLNRARVFAERTVHSSRDFQLASRRGSVFHRRNFTATSQSHIRGNDDPPSRPRSRSATPWR